MKNKSKAKDTQAELQEIIDIQARLEVSLVPRKDFQLEDHGSIWLFRPLTQAAKDFLSKTAPEDAQFLSGAMVVEPRYVEGVCDAIDLAGLTY